MSFSFLPVFSQVEYDRQMTAYRNSPGYQQYIQAKARGGAVVEDPEPRGVKGNERRIDIQPAEDEDDGTGDAAYAAAGGPQSQVS